MKSATPTQKTKCPGNLIETFTTTVDTALTIDTPSQIIHRILADPTHDGLRAASYDVRVRGGDTTSHPERLAHQPHQQTNTRRHIADIKATTRHARAVIAATTHLMAATHQTTTPNEYGWADATWDAWQLATTPDPTAPSMTSLELRLETEIAECDLYGGHPNQQPAHAATIAWLNAINDYQHTAAQWPRKTGRPPTSFEAAFTSNLADDDCCRICLAIEPVGTVRVRRRRKKRGLCWKCEEVERATGHEPWPSLMAAWHESDRGGRPRMWDAALSRWLQAINDNTP